MQLTNQFEEVLARPTGYCASARLNLMYYIVVVTHCGILEECQAEGSLGLPLFTGHKAEGSLAPLARAGWFLRNEANKLFVITGIFLRGGSISEQQWHIATAVVLEGFPQGDTNMRSVLGSCSGWSPSRRHGRKEHFGA